ncbi:hypothetical protein DDB_G0279643 [Dictyostelium discoideum AX4]|uniref:GH16 domain-containing protein n=1 Tax=Dictyostelium discoideum TaxID=44689 RepID=Q54WI3_DICDI|nr:hypothetical protein DDB_G0279643 [Dictyostelium discoideum AX4]EAL67596.1 hypothetical protein DDB_G0279643 [Dictyostelium discoideum AX4]|eukprot:XP_641570.1 hypothetical protein DDB_G0279643 [Dictyostelium discoideum AX4]
MIKNLKLILLLILVILYLSNDLVNCKTTPTLDESIEKTTKSEEIVTETKPTTTVTESSPITKAPTITKKPMTTVKPLLMEDSDDVSTTSASKKPGDPKFDPKSLFLCGTDIEEDLSEGSNFIAAKSTAKDDPYQCYLSPKNVKFGKAMTLKLENKLCGGSGGSIVDDSSSGGDSSSGSGDSGSGSGRGVESGDVGKSVDDILVSGKSVISSIASPINCLDHKISCAEVEHSDKMTYGVYSVVMAAAPASNTVTKIYASTGGKGQYSDIYFKVEGNTTVLKYGYTSYGKVTEFKNTISGSSFSIANNYTFYYSQDTLIWYFNTRQQGEINTKYAGPKSPPPPLRFRISLTNNENKQIKDASLPTVASVKTFTYTSVKCPSDSESEEENNWGPQKASYKYFSSNCTTYRPYWIFNDTLNEELGWTTELSNGTLRIQNTYFQRIGDNIAFGFNEYAKNLRFSNRIAFPIKRHKYLMFWMNGGYKGSQSLAIYLTYKKSKIGSVNLGDFIIGGIQKEHWYKVIIPMKSFQITPPTITLMDGFMIQPTYDGYMDMAYFDDVMFSNGSICMEPLGQMDVFKNGKLENGDPTQSVANVNFDSVAMKYKGKATIEYQIENVNRLQLNFMNGSIGIDEYDGMIFNMFYYPDNAYIYQGQEDLEASQHTYQRPLDCKICLLNEAGTGEFPCLSLSEYVGGIFPSNKWIQLSIPWNDLAVDFYGAHVGGVIIKTDLGGIHQGTLYISQISAAKYKPPHVDDDSSNSFKLLPTTTNLISILLISFYFLFIF